MKLEKIAENINMYIDTFNKEARNLPVAQRELLYKEWKMNILGYMYLPERIEIENTVSTDGTHYRKCDLVLRRLSGVRVDRVVTILPITDIEVRYLEENYRRLFNAFFSQEHSFDLETKMREMLFEKEGENK